jgi:hypothetical protein
MNTFLRTTTLLATLALLGLWLGGCNTYMLQGKVVRGAQSGIQLVYAGDERLKEQGVDGADVRITRDPDTLNRHLVGRTRSNASGEFTIMMDEFGTGWMQEQWMLQAIAQGYQNAETLMQLPGKNSKWRLLVTLAPGASTAVPDQDELMRDFEQFR